MNRTLMEVSLTSFQALVLLPPEVAKNLASYGWDRRQFQASLFREALVPYAQLSARARETVQLRRAEHGLELGDGVPVARSPDEILVVVTGGVGVKATFVPTWGGGTEAITRAIGPPAASRRTG